MFFSMPIRGIARLLMSAVLTFCLVACSKVTAENYQKISTGMSRAEVVALLGEPSTSHSSSLLGVSGESAVWESGKVKIEATFVNDALLTRQLVQQ
ncbi:DUF3862 domain-containing protein [Chitinibacter fontanus]|nr:DUF3862 domain-containing protein [Chitinibacter fontanus]